MESGHTPGRNKDEYWNGPIPWIGIRDATGNHGRILRRTRESITEAGVANSSARVLPAGTVCLSRTASVGFVVSMGVPMATSQDFINWVCGPDLNPKYLHYVLMCEQESIRRFAHGSVHQTLYYPEAKALHICLPSRSSQVAIAEVLSALDDKIECNLRVSRISADLAAAHFRRSAKAETVLDEVATLTMGQSPPGETYNESCDGVPFYQGTRDFGFRYPDHRIWCSAPTRFAKRGDVLVSVRAPVGTLNIATETCAIGRGLAAVGSQAFPSLLYQALAAEPAVWDPYEADGTVFGSINKAQLAAISVPWPTSGVVTELEDLLSILDQQVLSAEDESRRLKALRDTLLPRLLSGELAVREAEAFAEEAV